mmetsp:Transcript_21918/g.38880  ORF Transcript_21918/g.38880 Transcript_21918/m.38880 type:complete len:181 (+) Transcript_21918:165-707(+)
MSQKNAEAVADTKKENESQSQSVTVSANGKSTEKEASPEKQTEIEGGLELFTEDESTRVLRKVKIIDRSKEFQGKGESKKEDKKDEKLSEEKMKAMRAAFENWSIDKKSIGRTEVLKVLRKAGVMPSEADLDSIINGENGKINFEEWIEAQTRKNKRCKQVEPDDITEMEESLRRKRGAS